jgi:hypothetical protein
VIAAAWGGYCLMRSTMDGTDKNLEAMVARVRKHLGGGSLFGVA